MAISAKFILSPTFGILEKVVNTSTKKYIRIYIEPDAPDHYVLAPCDCRIVGFSIIRGVVYPLSKNHPKFQNEGFNAVYKADRPKRNPITGDYDVGELIVHLIRSGKSTELDIDVHIQVGIPPYITDTIYFKKKKGLITQGEIIAEIILGSHSEIHLNPRKYTLLFNKSHIGARLEGGVTPVAAYNPTG